VAKPVLSDAQADLIAALVGLFPWLLDLFRPSVQRRVRDVLPEKGASEKVAEDLRRRGT